MKYEEIITLLKSHANPENVEGMARFGINPKDTLGISMKTLRSIAKDIGKNHRLALELWDSGIHEARILAALTEESDKVTESQMEKWVKQFDSWDVCDQTISNLFDKTLLAWDKAYEWAGREETFVKRAGFVMMATLAVHNKKSDDAKFEGFLPLIERESTDERNFVKKAVNWALRQIGKRSQYLNTKAIDTAKKIGNIKSKSARWIAGDAIKELSDEKTIARIKSR